tara:strand:+ start:898 stop:1146 length:249 start_codon:yes stop_codon:yes gene_type:complete
MKINLYDSVLDGLDELIDEVSGSISMEFKGANPFDKEPVPPADLLAKYNTLTFGNKQDLLQNHGSNAFNELVQNMENLKRRA